MLNVVVEQNQNYGLVTSSRTVAQGLNKRHYHVMRDLENIRVSLPKSGESNIPLIIKSSYKNNRGREYEEFLLNKNGFILYMFNIQGYNDFKLAYINKFDEMEKQLKEKQNGLAEQIPNLKEHLNKIKIWEHEVKYAANIIGEIREKAEQYLGELEETNKETTVRDYAKKLKGAPVAKMYQWFRKNGYIELESHRPTEKALKEGLFNEIESKWVYAQGREMITYKTRITPKGQSYFAETFKNPQLSLE